MKSLLRSIRSYRTSNLLSRNTFSLSLLRPTVLNQPLRSSFLTTPLAYKMSTSGTDHKNIMKSSYQGSGFYVQQMLTGCLAIYSYYVQSGNDCFLIDPLFDSDQYQELIKSRGKTLKGIFVSHYHADYVSGQYQLQKKYGCQIYMGPKANSGDNLVAMSDKQTIKLGNVTLQCWHTPGHTEQSSCLAVIDDKGRRDVIFTGDTLFLNEVGRPDLAVKTDLTAQDLAHMLYNSIQKLKTLNDDIRIYPGHGSGSSCGKSIGKGDFCTLGTQKQNNYALKVSSQDDFVKQVLQDMPNPPNYFGYNANLNKFQPFFFKEAEQKVQKQLSPEQVHKLSKDKEVVVLDVRSVDQIKEGIIQNSICVGFDGAFANWVGTLFDSSTKFVIYGSDQQAKQSITRLFRIGYINIIGHANFSINEWKNKNYSVVKPKVVSEVIEPNTTVLDIRKPGQWKGGIVEGAQRMELSDLFKNSGKLDKNTEYIVHCKSGYRAKIGWSYLVSQGFKARLYPTSFDSIFNSGKAKKVQPN